MSDSAKSPEWVLDPVQQAAQAQFARQSKNYGTSHVLADVSDVASAAARMTIPAVADVLDVATGGGHAGLYFASLGHRVTLADIATPMLKRARELALERGLTVETRQHPAEALPYPDASFDLVTCRVAPHHFSAPTRFVRESARVLRPGGWLLVIDGSVPDDEPEAEAWIHRIEILRDPSHVALIPPRMWRAYCQQAGLEVAFAELHPLKQPDLEWYFETAATPAENREIVRGLIARAPAYARRVFRLGEEENRIVWWWPRITVAAQKAGAVNQ